MQILTLRAGDVVRIGADITITVLEVSENGINLKVKSPPAQRIVKVPAVGHPVESHDTPGHG